MRKLAAVLIFLALCLCASAQSYSTVNWATTNWLKGSVAPNATIIQPVGRSPSGDGQFIYTGPAVRFPYTNGGKWSAQVALGAYQLFVEGVNYQRPITFYSPGDGLSYDVSQLTTNLVGVGSLPLAVSQIVAGRGVSVSPANGKGTVTVNASPKLVIFEDDWPVDADDIFALDFGLRLMDQGQIKILATPYAGYALSNSLASPLADAICRHYGHPEILQGASGVFRLDDGSPAYLYYAGVPSAFSQDILTNNGSTYPDSASYPSALSVYRTILENAESNSVTMVFGGPLGNLWDLWRSVPDLSSPQYGSALISNKVHEIIIAAGTFPTNSNWDTDNLNYGSGTTWSQIVYTNMGVLVTFIPINESGKVGTINGVGAGGSIINRPHSDPTYIALRDFDNALRSLNNLAPLDDGAIAYQGAGQWTTACLLYAAYGTMYNGVQAFQAHPGNIVWYFTNTQSAPVEYWDATRTSAGKQQYLSLPQPALFYHQIYSNAFGTIHLPPAGNAFSPPTFSGAVPLGSQALITNGIVKGVTGFTPYSNSPAMDYWFSADAVTNEANSSAVVNLADIANKNPLMALASYATPIVKQGYVNGHAALLYTASSSQGLVCSNNTDGAVFTLVAVVKPNTVSGNYAIIGSTGGGNIEWRISAGHQQLLSAGTRVIGTGLTTLTAGNWYVLSVSLDASGNYMFAVNGAYDTKGTAPGSLFTSIRYPTLGIVNTITPGFTPNWTEFFDGYIAEAMRFGRVLQVVDFDRTVYNLGLKYGIATTPVDDLFPTINGRSARAVLDQGTNSAGTKILFDTGKIGLQPNESGDGILEYNDGKVWRFFDSNYDIAWLAYISADHGFQLADPSSANGLFGDNTGSYISGPFAAHNGMIISGSPLTNNGVVWLTGSGAPSGTWPVGSLYSRTGTGDQYTFKAGAWHAITAP